MKIIGWYSCEHGKIRSYNIEMEDGEVADAPQIEFCDVCDRDTTPLEVATCE